MHLFTYWKHQLSPNPGGTFPACPSRQEQAVEELGEESPKSMAKLEQILDISFGITRANTLQFQVDYDVCSCFFSRFKIIVLVRIFNFHLNPIWMLLFQSDLASHKEPPTPPEKKANRWMPESLQNKWKNEGFGHLKTKLFTIKALQKM